MPSNTAVIQVRKHICNPLNNVPGNTTSMVADETSFFWLLQQVLVWSDIIMGFCYSVTVNYSKTKYTLHKVRKFNNCMTIYILHVLPQ